MHRIPFLIGGDWMQEYKNFNYKIPQTVAQNIKNPLANFIFAEIYGLLESKGQANISNQTLSNRWDRKIRTVTDALKQLKEAKFITSQQIPNHRGRLFAAHNISSKDKFLLVPSAIKFKGYDTKLLTLNDLRIYGYLYAEYSKLFKVNSNKYTGEDIIITAKNTDIANFINIGVSTVHNSLKKLASLDCINLSSTHGKGLEIEINTNLIINSKAPINIKPVNNRLPLLNLHLKNLAIITSILGKPVKDRHPFNNLAIHYLYLNRTLTATLNNKPVNNRYPNLQITAILNPNFLQITAPQTCKRPPTNRVINRDINNKDINKGLLAQNQHTKNQNNNIFPISQNDIPPEREQGNIKDEIRELNQLDLKNSNHQSKEEKSEAKTMNKNINNSVSGSSDIDNFLDNFYKSDSNKPISTQSSNQEPKQVATVQEPINQETNIAVKPTPVVTPEPQASNETSNSSDKYAQSLGYSNYAELVHCLVLGKHNPIKQETTAVKTTIPNSTANSINQNKKPNSNQEPDFKALPHATQIFIRKVQLERLKLTNAPHGSNDNLNEILDLMKKGYKENQIARIIDAK